MNSKSFELPHEFSQELPSNERTGNMFSIYDIYNSDGKIETAFVKMTVTELIVKMEQEIENARNAISAASLKLELEISRQFLRWKTSRAKLPWIIRWATGPNPLSLRSKVDCYGYYQLRCEGDHSAYVVNVEQTIDRAKNIIQTLHKLNYDPDREISVGLELLSGLEIKKWNPRYKE